MKILHSYKVTLRWILDSPAFHVLFPNWWEVDSLQKPDQDAVALVELGVAFLADKLG